MTPAALEERLLRLWETPHTPYGWLSTVDHKKVAKRYLATAVGFLLPGGVEALLMRIQLARPGQTPMTPEMYDQIFTMHGAAPIPSVSGASCFPHSS